MEGLTIIGKKHKRIFITFLKVNNAYSAFVKNYYEGINPPRINNMFNNAPLMDLFGLFFGFSWCEHPSTLETHFDRYVYWTSLYEKWKSFCYYQEYKYRYNIW